MQPSAWSAHPCTGCSSKQSSGILEKPDLCSRVQGGSEKLSDEEIEATLEKVVRLLAYISDKDLFAEFFRKKLARRLLQEKSSSDEHERSILTRLKEQCGAQFTSKAGPPSGPLPECFRAACDGVIPEAWLLRPPGAGSPSKVPGVVEYGAGLQHSPGGVPSRWVPGCRWRAW